MKKLYFNSLLAIVGAGLLFVSCDKTMGSKDSFDAQYAVEAPTISISVTDITYNSSSVEFTIDDINKGFETGIYLSDSENMDEYSIILSKQAGEKIVITGLDPETNYYVKGYIYGKGQQVVFTDIKSFTTEEAPDLPLAGKYTATDSQYSNGNWIPREPYEVEIKVEGTSVTISNLWGGGEDIVGTYDSSTNIVSIASAQTVYVHASYGNAGIYFYNTDLSAYAETGYATFTPKGGVLSIKPYSVRVSAGSFGNFYTILIHNPVE